MKGNLFLSVIIPTYNRATLLDYTLRSITAQKLPKRNFEVIVCDDGSSDNTKQVVDNYRERLDIKYFFQEDKGFQLATVRNIGISQAKGDVCVFIDTGILLDENCLSAHADLHKGTSQSLAAIGYVLGIEPADVMPDKTVYEPSIDIENVSTTIAEFEKNSAWADPRDIYYKKYNDHIESLPAPWVFFWGANISARRKHLIDVGMFDETFNGRWGCEDNDMGFRLHQKGIKLVVCRASKSLHYPHEKGASGEKEQGYRNCEYFLSKYNAPEIQLFLDHYRSNFTDINEILLKKNAAF
jgi:glycosyltransferase involved in cell wall biosynthesis